MSASSLAATEAIEQPLSVIDWLGTQNEVPVALPAPKQAPDEPPITQSAKTPEISVQPLTERAARLIGLVPSNVTGLPNNIWAGSQNQTIVSLLTDLPDLTLPAAQALLYTVLLAEAEPPIDATDGGQSLTLARVTTLERYGALDPAISLIELDGVTQSTAHFDQWMRMSLLTGTEDRACDVLLAAPHLTEDYGARIFCAARARAWEDAALTLGSAQALKLMAPERLALLDRFLNPDVFEAAAPLPVPRTVDPLTFRLFESIGEPLSTVDLPRQYAVSDLRRLSGWKAQLDAAERLTRAGALPDNRLLGLYTERKAAASGGVWDRVAALQRFETALQSQSIDAVAKTLPVVWAGMQEARLEVAFASLFGPDLKELSIHGKAGEISRKITYLSPDYEAAAALPQTDSDSVLKFAKQIALGDLSGDAPNGIIPDAIYSAFLDAPPRTDLVQLVEQERLGEAVLSLLSLLHQGAGGKSRALTDALSTLRALGLEDTARRAALQILLLER